MELWHMIDLVIVKIEAMSFYCSCVTFDAITVYIYQDLKTFRTRKKAGTAQPCDKVLM